MRIEGDLEGTFALAPCRPGAADALLPALEAYPEAARNPADGVQARES